jgi:hypothetical protein
MSLRALSKAAEHPFLPLAFGAEVSRQRLHTSVYDQHILRLSGHDLGNTVYATPDLRDCAVKSQQLLALKHRMT